MGSDVSALESEVYGDITLKRFKFEHLDSKNQVLPNYGDVQKVLGKINNNIKIIESRSDNQMYVMKTQYIGSFSLKEKKLIQHYSKLLRTITHPCVQTIKSKFTDRNGRDVSIMEYFEKGDLKAYLAKKKAAKEPLSEDEILTYFATILLGVEQTHH